MMLDQQIRDWLWRYLEGRIDLEAFEDWFVDTTWDIHQSDNAIAQELTYEIDRLLGEFTSGAIDEQQLRDALARYAPTSWLKASDTTLDSQSAVSPEAAVAGRRRSGVFG